MSGNASTDSIPVRVIVRVRPLISLELSSGAGECVTVDEKTGSVFVNDRAFLFDEVFGSKCTQDFVYSESVSDLLSSSFNGYNTTIFAYGRLDLVKRIRWEQESIMAMMKIEKESFLG